MKYPCTHPALKTAKRVGFAKSKDAWGQIIHCAQVIGHHRPGRTSALDRETRTDLRWFAVRSFRDFWRQANTLQRSLMAATLHTYLGTGRTAQWNNDEVATLKT